MTTIPWVNLSLGGGSLDQKRWESPAVVDVCAWIWINFPPFIYCRLIDMLGCRRLEAFTNLKLQSDGKLTLALASRG